MRRDASDTSTTVLPDHVDPLRLLMWNGRCRDARSSGDGRAFTVSSPPPSTLTPPPLVPFSSRHSTVYMVPSFPPPPHNSAMLDPNLFRKKTLSFDESMCMGRARVNSMRNEKKWQRKDSIHTELRCNIDPDILKRNVDAKTFFEDDQVKDNGSIFCKRENFDSLRRVIPTSKFNGIHIKMEDDCPQGGDDIRLCLLKTLGAHDMRSLPCVACFSPLPIYDKYPLVDGIFFLSTLPRQGVPAVHLLFDGRPFYIEVLCVGCLWSHWECRHCGDDSFLGRSLILGTLYTFDVLSISACCTPLCHDCASPISVSPQLINYIKMGNYSLIHEPLTCGACGSTRDHLSRKVTHYNLSRPHHLTNLMVDNTPLSAMTSPKLGTDLAVDASIS